MAAATLNFQPTLSPKTKYNSPPQPAQPKPA